MAVQTVSINQFERFIAEHKDRQFELINGEIVEKSIPAEEHGEIAGIIFHFLFVHVKPRKLGRVGVEVRHQRPEYDRNSRLPDVSFIAGNRPLVTEGAVPQMPDIAIEVKSPDDTYPELRARAQFYLANGSRLSWVFDPSKRLIFVYHPDGREEILLEGELLTGGDMLPEFSVPVKAFFDDPLED